MTMADNLQNQQLQQNQEAIREARKKAQDESRKAVQEQREERARLTAEAAKRMESTQPTPTQEENDLAKVGVVVEQKEDDKSGPTVITHTIVANEPLGLGGYESQEARESRKAQEQHAQQRAEVRKQQAEERKAQQANTQPGYETRAARARE